MHITLIPVGISLSSNRFCTNLSYLTRIMYIKFLLHCYLWRYKLLWIHDISAIHDLASGSFLFATYQQCKRINFTWLNMHDFYKISQIESIQSIKRGCTVRTFVIACLITFALVNKMHNIRIHIFKGCKWGSLFLCVWGCK